MVVGALDFVQTDDPKADKNVCLRTVKVPGYDFERYLPVSYYERSGPRYNKDLNVTSIPSSISRPQNRFRSRWCRQHSLYPTLNQITIESNQCREGERGGLSDQGRRIFSGVLMSY